MNRTRARSLSAGAVVAPLSLSVVAVMFVMPSEAQPLPATYAADASSEVWRINKLDLDMSGDPSNVDLAIARAGGVVTSTGAATAVRSAAKAENLAGASAPSPHPTAVSEATGVSDTSGSTTSSGAAGSVTGTATYAASTLAARGRWVGDDACVTPITPLTSSTSASQGSGIAPAAIPAGTPALPIPIETDVPTEIPTELPSDFPTDLSSDLPTLEPTFLTESPSVSLPTESVTSILPSLPTESVTSILPSLPTESVTSILPSLPTESITLLSRTAAASTVAEGDVPMMSVAGASTKEQTFLQEIPGAPTDVRRVYAETTGAVTDPSKPLATFFGGEVKLTMSGTPKLSAYSNGFANGSQVDWAPAAMKLVVGTDEFPVPTNGTALAVPYSGNEDVVLTVSQGKLATAEDPSGMLARGEVSLLNVLIKHGDAVALDAELFPMAVEAVAPNGGVDCTVAERIDPQLVVKGRHNGARKDVVKADALAEAAGAHAKLFRKSGKKWKRIKSGEANLRGNEKWRVKDRNGKARTAYKVVYAATDATLRDVGKRKIR